MSASGPSERGEGAPDPVGSSGPRETSLVLVVLRDRTFATYPLPATGSLTVGRAEDCDVCIDDASISRRHARLHIGPPLCIEDLESANGVRIHDGGAHRPASDGAEQTARTREDEPRIEARTPVPIAPGKMIRLGNVMVVVQRAAAAQRTRSPADAPVSSGRLRGSPDADAKAQNDQAAIVVRDPAMVALHRLITRVGDSAINVLLLGETGVGKEIVAEAIWRQSPRAKQPLLRLNCGALSETLLESELFGHERGAFTGAVQPKAGLLESADGGVVFLDEIGELPPSTQVKLLRVLEDGSVLRVGALKPRQIDVRFISATNRELEREVAEGRFRSDLYYRISGISLSVPPLRERPSEIEPLFRSFVAHFAAQAKKPIPRISPQAIAVLERYAWPGNVRELRNVAERALVLSGNGIIHVEHVPCEKLAPPPKSLAPLPATLDAAAPSAPAAASETPTLDAASAERERIEAALAHCAGNQTRAAKLLGISRGTLVARLKQFNFPRPRT